MLRDRKWCTVLGSLLAMAVLLPPAFGQDEEEPVVGDEAPAATAKRNDGQRPKNFPSINLVKGSSPRYCQIRLDSLSDQVAYLMFDGDVTNGYKRMYIWSPGHDRYGEPYSSLLDDQTGTYRSFKSESIQGETASITEWTITYRAESSGTSYRDYRTGEMVTRKRRPVARFYFNVDMVRGPARRADRKAGRYPLDIGIRGRLPVSDAWEKMPSVLTPWDRVYCSMSRKPVYDKSRQGYLRCKAHLRFHLSRNNTYPVTVRNLPENAKVHMEIAPYLRETIYERNFSMEEIFMNHFDVRIPYGWYRMMWSFESDFFGAQALGGSSDSRPFAFAPPPPN